MNGVIGRLFGRLSREVLHPRPADTRPAPAPVAFIDGAMEWPEIVMLPSDGHIAEDGTWIVQAKIDGIHGAYVDSRIVSREGVPLDCALHCQPALARLEQAYGQPMVFVGEYSEEGGFNDTIAAFRRGEGVGVFWIFDALPLDDWRNGGTDTPIETRLAELRLLVKAADSPFVGALLHWTLDHAGLMGKAREIWAEGYEGIVAKKPGSGYWRERSKDWIRLKKIETADVPIVDLMIGKDGAISRIQVRTPHGPALIPVRAAAMRDELARLHLADQAIGHVVEVEYQLTTGATRSIRGANMVRLRPDKAVRA